MNIDTVTVLNRNPQVSCLSSNFWMELTDYQFSLSYNTPNTEYVLQKYGLPFSFFFSNNVCWVHLWLFQKLSVGGGEMK